MTAAAPVAAEDEPLAARLSGRRALVAYGLLGDATAALRRFGFDYMWAQQDWLRAVGAAPEVVRVSTAASVATNAARIRAALLAAERPALVIAHSKGGLEGKRGDETRLPVWVVNVLGRLGARGFELTSWIAPTTTRRASDIAGSRS